MNSKLPHWRSLVVAAPLSFVVAGVASFSWGALIVADAATSPGIPWHVAIMAAVLLVFWKYFGGSGPPKRTSEARRSLLRAHSVPSRSFAWSLIAGLSSIAALAGLWILMVRSGMPGGNPTVSTLAGLPATTVALTIVMASLVSPISEEAAFRGYAQVILERAYRPIVAVGVSSLLFMLWHGPTQGFIPGKLLFFYIVGVVFGTTAYLNKSILPALPVHVAGDLIFFTLIWPNDATQPLLSSTGLDSSFWITIAATVALSVFAVWAFLRLRRKANRQGTV